MKTLFTMNRKRDVFLSVFLTLFIISLAVCITVFFKQLYYFDIHYLDLPTKTGLSYETIKHNYDALIEYQSLFFNGPLELPDFPMSQTGRIHFDEVKNIFVVIQVICIISGLVSLVMVYQNIRQKEYRYLRLTSILCIGIPTIIGFLASIDFNEAFIIFHKIFFRNDYWIFDMTTDPIITILPERYFMHCFMMIVFIIILMSCFLYMIYRKKQNMILKEFSK